jgi:hypothetical protein
MKASKLKHPHKTNRQIIEKPGSGYGKETKATNNINIFKIFKNKKLNIENFNYIIYIYNT